MLSCILNALKNKPSSWLIGVINFHHFNVNRVFSLGQDVTGSSPFQLFISQPTLNWPNTMTLSTQPPDLPLSFCPQTCRIVLYHNRPNLSNWLKTPYIPSYFQWSQTSPTPCFCFTLSWETQRTIRSTLTAFTPLSMHTH